MIPKQRHQHPPSFDWTTCVIAAISGGICGYMLVSNRVPVLLFRLFAWLDLSLFTVIALWCVAELALPRLQHLWWQVRAFQREQGMQDALFSLVTECVHEAIKLEHQGRDTCSLIVRDEDQNLYALSPDDPEYVAVAQMLVRAGSVCATAPTSPDGEPSEIPFTEVVGGLGRQITVRDAKGQLRVLSPGDPGYAEAARIVVAHHPHLAPLFEEEDDESSERPDDENDREVTR